MKTWIFAVLVALLAPGCSILDATEDASDTVDDINDLLDDGLAVLRDLFPDLSEDEILSISLELSYDDIVALRDELEPIREEAARLSDALFTSASEVVEVRNEDLAAGNAGYPETVSPIGAAAFYNDATGEASIVLSGIFRNEDAVAITNDNVTVTVDGEVQETTTTCLNAGETVDIVFLLDITGSMRNVIRSVQNSLLMFVDAIEGSGLQGTISLVTFQDSVGVNVTFQQPAPAGGTERSPFFAPVAIDNLGQVEALRDFINTLEANMGADAPENLAGAIDFARNNVIGYTSSGQPNVVGDHVEDPPDTAPFPGLASDRQVFVAFTDITFHSDSRDEDNSSLLAPFVPRDIDDILASLVQTGTVVNISDPARVDETVAPTGASDEVQVDADYWAIRTGGVGEDVASGYSIMDLEVVVVGGRTGLLDITLDRILQSTCHVDFNASLNVDAQVEFTITESEETFTGTLDFHWF